MSEKTRDSNIELLRIISMLMIIAYHEVTNGLQFDLWHKGSFLNRSTVAFLYPAGRCGVMLFFMITGFFLCKKQWRNCSRIVIKSCFYSVITAFVYIVLKYIFKINLQVYGGGYVPFRHIFMPISSGVVWFITCYVILILCLPLLNKFLNKLNKKYFLILLLFMNFNLYGLGTILNVSYEYLYEALFFYSCGAFYRNYIDFKNKKFLISFAFISYILGVFLSYWYYRVRAEGLKFSFVFLLGVRNICVPVFCFSLFGVFKSFSIKSRKIINNIAAASFAVYLLHGSVFQKIIWDNFFQISKLYYTRLFPVAIIMIAFIVYFSAYLIDFICDRLILQHIYKKVDSILLKVKQNAFLGSGL